MAWIDLSGANAPINSIGTDQGVDISTVKDFNRIAGFNSIVFNDPDSNGIFNPYYRQQIIDEEGGGGSTRPTSGMLYPRGQG